MPLFRRSDLQDAVQAPSPLRRRRRRRGLWADRRCTTSLELAIIAAPFFAMLLGLMDAGYDLFVQAELDTAVNMAARGVQVGSVTGTKGETSAQLAAAAVCPNLRGLLNCSLLTVGVIHIPTDYYQDQNPLTFTSASSTGGSVCTGTGGQLMLLQAWYQGPTFVGRLIPGFSQAYGNKRVHFTSSSAGFVDEYFSGGQSSGTGC